MNYDTARARLLNHANLTFEQADAPDEESILFILFDADRTKIAPTGLSSMRRDIIECLEVVNINWNGAIPSQTSIGEKEIERYLAVALSQIIHSCWNYFRTWQERGSFESEILDQLSYTTWSVSCAWNLVLAGDFDSIAESVESEASMRDVF